MPGSTSRHADTKRVVRTETMNEANISFTIGRLPIRPPGGIRERDIAVLQEPLGKDIDRLNAEGLSMPYDEVIKLALSSFE